MSTTDYYATYCRFNAETTDESALLFGADCSVGDVWEITIPSADGVTCAALVNRFGATVGHLDADMTEQVQLAQARGWEVHAILASVYLTDVSEGADYWGEVVVMCFTPNTPFETFLHTVANALAEGARPTVDLGKSGIAHVMESNGDWLPETRVPKITVPEGSALVKDARTFNERVVEQARQRNPGCLAVGWLFIAALVAAVCWLIWRFLLS